MLRIILITALILNLPIIAQSDNSALQTESYPDHEDSNAFFRNADFDWFMKRPFNLVSAFNAGAWGTAVPIATWHVIAHEYDLAERLRNGLFWSTVFALPGGMVISTITGIVNFFAASPYDHVNPDDQPILGELLPLLSAPVLAYALITLLLLIEAKNQKCSINLELLTFTSKAVLESLAVPAASFIGAAGIQTLIHIIQKLA